MRLNWRHGALAVTVGGGLALAACGGTGVASPSYGAPHGTSQPAHSSSLSVKTAQVSVAGRQETILTTSSGKTLYYFTADQQGKVMAATPALLMAWPPLLLPHGATTATSSAHLTGKLGVLVRPDGTKQVTYDGWPLYAFAGDKFAGDLKGQGIGGKWFAATTAIPEVVPAIAPPPAATPAATPAPAPPTPVAPAPAPPVARPTPPPPPPAFNDNDTDNNGGPSDGDGNG